MQSSSSAIEIPKDAFQLFVEATVNTVNFEIVGKRRLNVLNDTLKMFESIFISFYKDEDDFTSWPAGVITSSLKDN